MSNGTIFEVRVAVEEKSEHFSIHASDFVKSTMVKLFHIPARTPQQACDKARKHGRPLEAHKINREKIFGNIEALKISETQPKGVYAQGNPYNTAVAMDEMIWLKRNNRRKNMVKDKTT